MQPRARKRQRTEPSPSPSVLSQEQEDEQEARPTFYNTTYSLHRVSPLYVGVQPLNRQRLQLLSQRLREVLVGDVVRGVEVGLALGRQAGEGESGGMGRAGALEYVDIRWVNMSAVLGITGEEAEDSDEGEEDTDTGRGEDRRGEVDWSKLIGEVRDKKALHILLRYEMAECTALLFPSASYSSSSSSSSAAAAADDDGEEAQPNSTHFLISGSQPADAPDSTHFVHLPLLLLRMAAPLKAVITDFLSTTFDCRISSLRLGTRSLVQSWESWISTAGLPGTGGTEKDVVLTLGFYIPPADNATAVKGEDKETTGQEPLGIKAIDIIIPSSEVRSFFKAGKQLAAHLEQDIGKEVKKEKPTWETNPTKRRKLAGRLGEEGWEWRSGDDNNNDDTATKKGQKEERQQQSPFTEALGKYVDKHLGLNLFHPGVRVTKIACGGFVMSEGRVKVFVPRGGHGGKRQRAGVWKLVRGLVGKAEGHGGKGLV